MTGGRTEGEPGRNEPLLQVALRVDAARGLYLASMAKLGVGLVIGVQTLIQAGFPHALYYHAFILAFVLAGWWQYRARQPGLDRPWKRACFPLLEVGIITVAVMTANPFVADPVPPPVRLLLGGPYYLYILLAIAVLGQSVKVILWYTAGAVLAWSLGVAWIAAHPGVIVSYGLPADVYAMDRVTRAAWLTDPFRIRLEEVFRQNVIFVVIGGTLALAVERMRRLTLRAARAERARANLARHFSPRVVDEIVAQDDPIGPVRHVRATVLFVDLVDFSSTASRLGPDGMVRLLRAVHARLAGIVFAHGGTLDKFLGDGLMATFGTPKPGARDTLNALAAARAMPAALADLRSDAGAPLRLAMGLHAGEVVLGNIGDEHTVEFAVLGDAVNFAHRLEEFCRPLAATLVISAAVAGQARAEDPLAAEPLLAGLRPVPGVAVRGFAGQHDLLVLPRAD